MKRRDKIGFALAVVASSMAFLGARGYLAAFPESGVWLAFMAGSAWMLMILYGLVTFLYSQPIKQEIESAAEGRFF